MKIEELWIYPIKSCKGHQVESALLESTGLRHDRHWMLVDNEGVFLSQRKFPQMALLNPQVDEENQLLKVSMPGLEELQIPLLASQLESDQFELTQVRVWKDVLEARKYPIKVSNWFSSALSTQAHLVKLANKTSRMRTKPSHPREFSVSFADSGPVLLTNRKSLEAIEKSSGLVIEMSRFRSNIITCADKAFEEERWNSVSVGGSRFETLYPCERCTMITIDQMTALQKKAVFQALANYRKQSDLDQSVNFGVLMIPDSVTSERPALLRTGDKIESF